MKSTLTILNNYGRIGVELLKFAVEKVTATGKTSKSIHFETDSNNETDRLTFFAREFFGTLESGRGPRKSSGYGKFDKSLLEYLEARGLVSGLTQKQKESKAKSLAWYINKHGDKTYRDGGREVYSKQLDKLVEEMTKVITKDTKDLYIKEIRNAFSTKA